MADRREAFERRVLRVEERGPDGCWGWDGHVSPAGYARIGRTYAHRISYELSVGPIPAGLELDHLCRNPICTNPTHLEAVSPRVNKLRGTSPTARQAAQTECVRGHALSGSNLVVVAGKRQCLTCTRYRAACVKVRRERCAFCEGPLDPRGAGAKRPVRFQGERHTRPIAHDVCLREAVGDRYATLKHWYPVPQFPERPPVEPEAFRV